MKNLRHSVTNANALLVFESAARNGSFTRAAEELGISQPAVTRHVRTVENAIGRPLFHRRHNRLAITEDGTRLLTAVSAGFGEIASTIDSLRATGDRRRLVLAAHSGFAQHWLMPRFSDLCRVLDAYDVRLMIADTNNELDRGDYDIAVRVGSGDWHGQKSLQLIPETVFPVAAPSLIEACPNLSQDDPETLLPLPLLHMDDGDMPWSTWRSWFRHRGIRANIPRPEVLYHNYPLVLQQALAGQGIALAWLPLTDQFIEQDMLIPVGPKVINPDLGYHLAWRTDTVDETLTSMIRQWFSDQFGVSGEES